MDRPIKAIFNPMQDPCSAMAAVCKWFPPGFLLYRGGRQTQLHEAQTLSEIFILLSKCLHVCINCCFFEWDASLPISSFYLRRSVYSHSESSPHGWKVNSGFDVQPWWLTWVLCAHVHTCSHLVLCWQTERKPGSCVYLPTGPFLQRGHVLP